MVQTDLPAPIRSSREYRASVAFLISGLYTLLVVALLSSSLTQSGAPLQGALTLWGAFAQSMAMLAIAIGVASSRRWATAVTTPLLGLLVVTGVIEVFFALTRSTLEIPVGALLAIWAFRAPLRAAADLPPIRQSWSVVGAVVIGAMVLFTAWPLITPVLVQAGGPLVVGKDALQPSLVLTCTGAPKAPPATVTVRYDWRWSRSEPWVTGTDSLTLEAYTRVGEGSGGYALDMSGPTSAGIWDSDVIIGEPVGGVFGIDLSQAGFDPGYVALTLDSLGTPQFGHGSIDARATYLHAPVDPSGPRVASTWRVRTDASCEW